MVTGGPAATAVTLAACFASQFGLLVLWQSFLGGPETTTTTTDVFLEEPGPVGPPPPAAEVGWKFAELWIGVALTVAFLAGAGFTSVVRSLRGAFRGASVGVVASAAVRTAVIHEARHAQWDAPRPASPVPLPW